MNRMKRIIIADDEPLMTRVLKLTLERAGYSVKVCPNGREALQAVREQLPDILITDIQMPLMNGQQLCEAIHAEMPERRFPIFVMTSMTDREHREWTARIGGITFLEKPLSMRIIMQRFEDALRAPAALDGELP